MAGGVNVAARPLFDFVEGLRVGEYALGADPARDGRVAALLSAAGADAGLRDALCMKLMSPGLEWEWFRLVASHAPDALPMFQSDLRTMWDKAGYDVGRVVGEEFHQDVALLLDGLADLADSQEGRRGVLEAAAYLSFMKGDRGQVFESRLGRLAGVAPDGEITRALYDAYVHHADPAWIEERSRAMAAARPNGDARRPVPPLPEPPSAWEPVRGAASRLTGR